MNNDIITERHWMATITTTGLMFAMMVSMLAGGMGCGGSPETWYQKGEDAYCGRERSQSDEDAVKWYRKAAEKGHAGAQNKLGTMYKEGRGIVQDEAKAVLWFRRAAEQGDADAQCNLGVMYEHALGVMQDYQEAEKWYRKAADQGYARGQRNLGSWFYWYGNGVDQNYEEAFRWWHKAAEQGDAIAQYDLGLCYGSGSGVEKDYEQAFLWYHRAAEQGEAQAQCALGSMYENGQGVEKNAEEAVLWYQKAAEQGYANAQCNLAWMYEKGRGVENDYGKAVSWYRKAADQGYARGQVNLGNMYFQGSGVEKDFEEAIMWYRKAADQGYAIAQKKLGEAYEDGLGVTRDFEEAVRWYRKAMEQGNLGAMHRLGWMYENGYGVEQDDTKALALYRKAAEQGNADAQFSLGCRYQKGRGVEQNKELAMEWYQKAADQGLGVAKINLMMMTATEEEKAEIHKALSDMSVKTYYVETLRKMEKERDAAKSKIHQAGDIKTITLPGGATMELVWCPPGSFMMGTQEPELPIPHADDEVQHNVTLTHGFWMARTEVTQKQWMSVEGYNPSEHKGVDWPVECVNWHDCKEFCRKAGLQLPTEAEWEYACRAGSTGDFGGTGEVEDMGWCDEEWGEETIHPTGRKNPNAWGLYDMHGNVQEWCADWYDDYSGGEETDPTGGWGDMRVLRGGTSMSSSRECRSASRFRCPPDVNAAFCGFRPVLRAD